MFIVNLKDFLALPNNTLYQKFKYFGAGDLEVRMGTDGNDFYVGCLTGPVCTDEDDDTQDLISRFEKMENDAKSGKRPMTIPLSKNVGWDDGKLDEDQLFLVYEQKDIKTLISMLKTCVGAVPPPRE